MSGGRYNYLFGFSQGAARKETTALLFGTHAYQKNEGNRIMSKHFNEGDRVIVRYSSGEIAPAIYWKRSDFADIKGAYPHIVKPIAQPDLRYFAQFEDDDIWLDGGMSGGHWEYRHFIDSGYASDLEIITNAVTHDLMGLSPIYLVDVTFSQREVIEEAVAYLERITPEVRQLTERLEQLLGYGSVYSQVVAALDKAYSDDISLASLEGVLRHALKDLTP